MPIGFSVIMPVYNQACFIKRAVTSLQRQTYPHWELIIINDGSDDELDVFVDTLLPDPRITYLVNDRNRGLGYSANRGLDQARYGHVAYLPADDFYDPEHLETLAAEYERYDNAVLVFSGIRYGTNDSIIFTPNATSEKLAYGERLTLVQTSHRKTADRWVERSVWESPDLHSTFWDKLLDRGSFVATRRTTCFLTKHPKRRSRIIAEGNSGGLNVFRRHYNIREPLKLRVHKTKFVDEEKSYARYAVPHTQVPHGLKILVVGELSYNPERIVALEEAGHKLYGLWVNHEISGFNTVGPLPFGNIEDVEFEHWRRRVREIKPDIIYATLNFRAITLAYDVLREMPDIPFVWHFKEGPTISLKVGTWDKLMYIYNHADGIIHISQLMKEWVDVFANPRGLSMIMDGDLPRADHFVQPFTRKLSDANGEIHTVVTGRMIGWSVPEMLVLSHHRIHLHHYSGDGKVEEGINRQFASATRYFHAHAHCGIADWVSEFSKYDAGWMHKFQSRNNGDLLRATWDDLNVPARISTYAAAGLPVITPANAGHLVSTNQIAEQFGIGIMYDSMKDLVPQLLDTQLMETKRNNMLTYRDLFTFDHYVPALERFFNDIIQKKHSHESH